MVSRVRGQGWPWDFGVFCIGKGRPPLGRGCGWSLLSQCWPVGVDPLTVQTLTLLRERGSCELRLGQSGMSRGSWVAGSCCWPGLARTPEEGRGKEALWDHPRRLKLVANWVSVIGIQESNVIDVSEVGSFMVDSRSDQSLLKSCLRLNRDAEAIFL